MEKGNEIELQQQPEEEKKKRRKFILIILLLAAVAIAAIVSGMTLAMQNLGVGGQSIGGIKAAVGESSDGFSAPRTEGDGLGASLQAGDDESSGNGSKASDARTPVKPTPLVPVYPAPEGANAIGDCWWYITPDGTLTIAPSLGETASLPNWGDNPPWHSQASQIKNVEIKGTVYPETMHNFFSGCDNLENFDLSGLDTSKVNDLSGMFNGCKNLSDVDLSNIDTGNVTNISNIFSGCENLTNVPLATMDTSNVKDMSGAFSGCTSLESADLSGVDTSNVENMSDMFGGCENLKDVNLADTDTSNVKDMSGVFSGCTGLESVDLSGVDTSSVENMSGLLEGCTSLKDVDLSGLDTSNVTDISNLFSGCENLENVNLDGLDTGNVTDMSGIFSGCRSLETVDMSDLDTSKVENMDGMFNGCTNLGEIELPQGFDVDKAASSGAFDGCIADPKPDFYTQPEGAHQCGSCWWNVDSDGTLTIAPMEGTQGVLDPWTNGAPWSDEAKNIREVVVKGSVETPTCADMFAGCTNLAHADVSGLGVNEDTDLTHMFANCKSLEDYKLPENFDVEKADEQRAFEGCPGAPEPSFYTKPPNAQQWGTCWWVVDEAGELLVVPMEGTTGEFGQGVAPWISRPYNSQVKTVTMKGTLSTNSCDRLFEGCYNLESVDLSHLDTTGATDMSEMFSGCSSLTSVDVSSLNTSAVTQMENMFYGCTNLESLDLSTFDTSAVANMSSMFHGCTNLESVDLSSFNTSAVTSMNNMFYCAESLTELNMENFDASKVTSLGGTFYHCSNLADVKLPESYDANKAIENGAFFGCEWQPTPYPRPEGSSMYGSCWWQVQDDTLVIAPAFGDAGELADWGTGVPPWYNSRTQYKKVEVRGTVRANTCHRMFEGCSNVESMDLAGLDTTGAPSMENMFYCCYKLDSLDLSGFNTSAVASMGSMFRDCQSLTGLDLSSFKTPAVTKMDWMFAGCVNLQSVDLSSFKTPALVRTNQMFRSCPKITAVDVSGFSMAKTSDMSGMFYHASQLEDIKLPESCDVNTAVTQGAFFGCPWQPYVNTPYEEGNSLTDTSHWWIEDGTLYIAPAYGDSGVLANWGDGTPPWYGRRGEIVNVIVQGDVKARTCKSMFEGCYNLESVDLRNLDTSAASSMEAMFYGCSKLGSLDLSCLETSSVSSMTNMFRSCQALTSLNVSGFDTTTVTKMNWMFHDCRQLRTVDLSSFDTSAVRDISYMFYSCPSLETLDVTGFDLSAASSMYAMFDDCSSLKALDFSNTRVQQNVNTGYMFYHDGMLTDIKLPQDYPTNDSVAGTTFLGCAWQPYPEYARPEGSNMYGSCWWQVQGDTLVIAPAFGASGELADWGEGTPPWYNSRGSVKHVQVRGHVKALTCRSMFHNFSAMETADLAALDTTGVTTMLYMFYNCTAVASLDLSGFNTQAVRTMQEMFNYCSALQSVDLSSFRTSAVTNMYHMFHYCKSLTAIDLSNFDTSAVTTMYAMFAWNESLTSLDLSMLDACSATDMTSMFYHDAQLAEIKLPKNFATDTAVSQGAFFGCLWQPYVTYARPEGSNMYGSCWWQVQGDTLVIAPAYGDAGELANWGEGTPPWYNSRGPVKHVQVRGHVKAPTCYNMFTDFSNMVSIDLSGLSGVGSAQWMFRNCSQLTSLDLTGFDASYVTSMHEMFYSCSSLASIDMSNLNTSRVTSMYHAFYNCNTLTTLDLSALDTSSVTTMYYLFDWCTNLVSINLSGVNTSAVTDMSGVFSHCNKLESINLSSFDTSNVTTMRDMFYENFALTALDLSHFEAHKLGDMTHMFFNCSELSNIRLSESYRLDVAVAQEAFYGCKWQAPFTYPRPEGSGAWGTCWWKLDADNVLTIAPLVGDTGEIGNYGEYPAWWSHVYDGYYGGSSHWHWQNNAGSTKKVVLLGNIKMSTCKNLFNGLGSLTSLDLSNLDLTTVTDMTYMFAWCSSLESITFPNGFDMKTAVSQSAFHGCKWQPDASLADVEVSNTCTWQIDDSGTLVVSPLSGSSGTLGNWGGGTPPWYSERQRITGVSFRGSIKARTCSNMFANCNNLTTVDLSGLDTSSVSDMHMMFNYCTSIESANLSMLDTRNVTDMRWMFQACTKLTSVNLSGLDTRSVTATYGMFAGCTSLTSVDLSMLDAYKATDLGRTFYHCDNLANIKLPKNFDTNKAIEQEAFFGCPWQPYPEFARPEGSTMSESCWWQVQGDTLVIAPAFGTSGTLADWAAGTPPWYSSRGSVKHVEVRGHVNARTCKSMFEGFGVMESANLAGLDTTLATTMATMFYGCSNVGSLDLSSFNTSRVTSMYALFDACYALESVTLNSFDTHLVTDMGAMFYECRALDGLDLSSFDTANTTSMWRMFFNCYALTGLDLSSFDCTKAPNMDCMFYHDAQLTDIKLSNSYDARRAVEQGAFFGCAWQPYTEFPRSEGSSMYGSCWWQVQGDTLVIAPAFGASGTLADWATGTPPWYNNRGSVKHVEVRGHVSARTCKSMFEGYSVMTSADLAGLDTSLSPSMQYMFYSCSSIESLDLSGFDTARVTTMYCMFERCSNLKSVDLSSFNTTRLTNMGSMFYACVSLAELDLSSFDTSNVTSMHNMLNSCAALESLDFSMLDASKVTSMDTMFYHDARLSDIKLPKNYNAQTAVRQGAFFGCAWQPYTEFPRPEGSSMYWSCWWQMQGDTLVIAPAFGAYGELDNWGTGTPPWYGSRGSVKHVEVRGHVKADTCKSMFQEFYLMESADLAGLDTSISPNMEYMFYGCNKLASLDLSGFDTSSAINMQYMFAYCYLLANVDVTSFVTSAVVNMTWMFSHCEGLPNVDVSSFQTSSVTDMSYMFDCCYALEKLDLSGFDAARTTGMTHMFYHDAKLADIKLPRNYDTETAVRQEAFFGCLWQPYTEFPRSEGSAMYGSCWWQVQDGTLVIAPAFGASGRLDDWGGGTPPWFGSRGSVKNVEVRGHVKAATCKSAFQEFYLMESADLAGLSTTGASNMEYMFYGCDKLASLDLSGFDTSSVTNMQYMFCYCRSLESLDVAGFDTAAVVSMYHMFNECKRLVSLDLSSFGTRSVTTMHSMFAWNESLTSLDLSGFDCAKLTDMTNMFYHDGALADIKLSGSYPTRKAVEQGAFLGCLWQPYDFPRPEGSNVSGSCWWQIVDGTLSIAPVSGASGELADWGAGTPPWYGSRGSIQRVEVLGFVKAMSCQNMFSGCSNMASADLAGLSTTGTGSMQGMFSGCSSLDLLDLSGFDTTSVSSMQDMFRGCTLLRGVNLADFNTTAVINMANMFYGCHALASVDMSSFNTSAVLNMAGMFYDCKSLQAVNLSSFNTGYVKDMSNMFWGCAELGALDITNFRIGDSTNLTNMFYHCSKLANLGLPSTFSLNKGVEQGSFFGCLWQPFDFPRPENSPMSNTCWWQVDAQGTLTIAPAFGKFGDLADWGAGMPPWYGDRGRITSVVIQGHVKAPSAHSMFEGCSQLTSASLAGLNITDAVNVGRMFYGCSSIARLDMSDLKASAATDMSSMFFGCSALVDLKLPAKFDVEVAIGQDAFKDCAYQPVVPVAASEDTGMTAQAMSAPARSAQAAAQVDGGMSSDAAASEDNESIADAEATEAEEAVPDDETPLSSGAADEDEDDEEGFAVFSWTLAALLIAVAALLVVLSAMLRGPGRRNK